MSFEGERCSYLLLAFASFFTFFSHIHIQADWTMKVVSYLIIQWPGPCDRMSAYAEDGRSRRPK